MRLKAHTSGAYS